VEPAPGPAHLPPRPDFARQQAQFAELVPPRLVEVFGDDGRPRNRGAPFLHHHRSRAGGIENEELLAALPHALLHRPRGDADFAGGQVYATRVRADGVVDQCQPAALRIAAVWGRAPAGPAAAVTLGCSRPFG